MTARRQRFISEETQVLDYFKPKDAALARPTPRTNRRGSGRMTEREEVSLSPFHMSHLRALPSDNLPHAQRAWRMSHP